MKELKKGNKAPYRGYLLNVGEYERYMNQQLILKKAKAEIESWKKTDGGMMHW